jgi:predicted membrane GTPase involved in stress response
MKSSAVSLTPAIKLDLEQALEFIDDDELVEVTPNNTSMAIKSQSSQPKTQTSLLA